jgi:hypothetical protein
LSPDKMGPPYYRWIPEFEKEKRSKDQIENSWTITEHSLLITFYRRLGKIMWDKVWNG